MTTETLIPRWITEQYAANLSKRTVRERAMTIRRIARDLNTDPVTLTADQLLEWLAEGDWSASSRATYHSHLRSWFDWLQARGHRLDNPLAAFKAPRRPRSTPHPVPAAYIPQLLGAYMWQTTRAYILLAVYAGLRVHEIAKVNGKDVDLIGGTIRVTGKGGTVATIPMHPELAAIAETMPRSGWWFPATTGRGHVAGQSVGITIARVMERVGVPGTAHSLRHTFATELVHTGTDLRVVQDLLRHASLATTQIYVQVADGRKSEAVVRLPNWTPTKHLRRGQAA